jgi:hypothetical protein
MSGITPFHKSLNKRLVLFNGPRHSGKDTAVDYLWQKHQAFRFKMSRPLKDAIKAFFNLSSSDVDYLESKKTEPDDLLFGQSYVDVQIAMSEHWAKEFFGTRIFGKMAARELFRGAVATSANLYLCSDCGFDYEADPLIELFGASNVLLVRLHRTGKTFEGDSRSYVSFNLPGLVEIDFGNNGTQASYEKLINEVVIAWLDTKQ